MAISKLLAFNLPEADHAAVVRAAILAKTKAAFVTAADYDQTLAALLQAKTLPIGTYEGEIPAESLLVMCNLSGAQMTNVLMSLRKSGTRVTYKAILTPTNLSWTPPQMLEEMAKEKAQFDALEKEKSAHSHAEE
ncbi:MAG: DUF3783 domain-containing protein [Clostridia bacterium]|nr:DUF3783 domain-containing protein [Clostridia bacterium]